MVQLQLILLFIFLLAAPASAGDDPRRYIRENRLLQEELVLARKGGIYFVFNLNEKIAHIKARGIPLKELRMIDVRCWGSPVAGSAYRLIGKSAFFKPDRETIKPGEGKKNDRFEIEALELADMPSRYTLVFDGGMKIWIGPTTEGIATGMGNVFHAAMRLFIRPISTLWHALRRKPYTAIDIALDQNDARAIYWSLPEGASAIIYPP
jgi:hypothetical protein